MKKVKCSVILKKPEYWLVVLVIILLPIAVIDFQRPYRVEYPREVESAVEKAAENAGLRDVQAVATLYKEDGRYHYGVQVYCSNFGEYSPRKMLSIHQSLEAACDAVSSNNRGASVSSGCGGIHSGGHVYVMYHYVNMVTCDGETIFDDYEHSGAYREYLEDHPEKAKSEADRKANLPYVGMPESRINSTILGKPSDVIRHNTAIKNGNRYTANLYDFVRNGKVIYTVRCVDGYVTETWDDRDSPVSVPVYHASNPSDDDPYDAASYSNEEDFYDDHYDDFFDFYDAEQYWRDHQE